MKVIKDKQTITVFSMLLIVMLFDDGDDDNDGRQFLFL